MIFTRRHLLGLFMITLAHGREYTGKGFDAVSGEKTGFFHVENQNGIWWVIDPNGKGTLVRGVNVFRMSGWRCERLNNRKLYQENALKKYGSVEAWAKASVERLKRWGFNTVNEQYEINPIRSQEIAYTYLLSMAEGFTRWRDDSEEADKYRLVHKTWHSLPNVYHPDWKAYCEKTAQAKCAAFKDDPYLLGYFLDNERAWLGPERLTAEIWRKPASHTAKIALVQMAMKYFGSIEAINRHWQTAYTSVDDFLNDRTAPTPGGKEATAFCRFFFRDVAERFFSDISKAIRKVDPNHMLLGTRDYHFDAIRSVLDIMGKYCDVISTNDYAWIDVEKGVPSSRIAVWRELHEASGRPVLITEWSFPALDSGLPCRGGAGMRVETQAQRARCFTFYQGAIMSQPYMIGSLYFCWADQPKLGVGRFLAEDGNYGLVKENDDEWPELVAAATQIHARAEAIHAAAKPMYIYHSAGNQWEAPLPEKGVYQAGQLSLELIGRGVKLKLDGQDLGFLIPVLRQRRPENRWVSPRDARIVDVRTGKGFTVLDIQFSHPGDRPEERRDAAAFAAIYRLVLPARGEWFASQPISVRNCSTQEWTLVDIHNGVFPANGKTAQPVKVPIYKAGVWEDRAAQLGLASTTASGDMAINYWSRDGHPFADAKFRVDKELAPGEEAIINGPIVFHCGYRLSEVSSKDKVKAMKALAESLTR